MEYFWNEEINIEELKDLFRSNDWRIPKNEILENSFQFTWKWLSCYQEDSLIGFVRILSDGFHHAYICSMIVHKNYHNQNIGKEMMNLVLAEVKENNLAAVLVAKDEVQGFYDQFGFKNKVHDKNPLVFEFIKKIL